MSTKIHPIVQCCCGTYHTRCEGTHVAQTHRTFQHNQTVAANVFRWTPIKFYAMVHRRCCGIAFYGAARTRFARSEKWKNDDSNSRSANYMSLRGKIFFRKRPNRVLQHALQPREETISYVNTYGPHSLQRVSWCCAGDAGPWYSVLHTSSSHCFLCGNNTRCGTKRAFGLHHHPYLGNFQVGNEILHAGTKVHERPTFQYQKDSSMDVVRTRHKFGDPANTRPSIKRLVSNLQGQNCIELMFNCGDRDKNLLKYNHTKRQGSLHLYPCSWLGRLGKE